jgi:hypothetical protein
MLQNIGADHKIELIIGIRQILGLTLFEGYIAQSDLVKGDL